MENQTVKGMMPEEALADISLEKIKKQTEDVMEEFVLATKVKAGDLVVIGCSSSEIAGEKIGTYSSEAVAKVVVGAIMEAAKKYGIDIAAQCCEHLNRALIVEEACAKTHGFEQVNVIPAPKAGGSFATGVYKSMQHPMAVEYVRADAGIDIGDTLIGMHLKAVAVPVRIQTKQIGEARVVCARTRCKFVGGSRAVYNEELL